MKFNNGQWLFKDSVKPYVPAEVYFVKESKDGTEVHITAPTKKIENKGGTLGGVVLTITVSTPMENVIRVRATHHKGGVCNNPEFEINPGTNKVNYKDTDDLLVFTSGIYTLEINKKNWEMQYKRNGELVSKSSSQHIDNDLAYLKVDYPGEMTQFQHKDNTFMRQSLSLGVGTNVYGLGERFTNFVKNGQTVDVWQEDGGTASEQAYKNIPFYITSNGYGVFVNHPEKVSFEIGSEDVKKVSFSVKGEELDYFFIGGKDMKDILVNYTSITGKPDLPAPWTFGLWLSTSFLTDYDEKTVMGFVDGMAERKIPLSVLHFDCLWMKEYHWTNFKWDERMFNDPEGMLKRLKDKGLRSSVWINSYIAQDSEMFDEGIEKGYFLKRKNGEVFQWDQWQPGMTIVDFTNPEASKWYTEKMGVVLDQGVDAVKTDFGERIPWEDIQYFDGSNPEKMHNFYAYKYNKAVYEYLKSKRPNNDAILYARSATAGCQKFPVHWGGDCWSDFESMAESLRGGLSLQLSGFGFWSHDIGGFESKADPAVYKRWAAFGLLSSHSRLHGSTSYRVPWVYDEEAVDVVRFFTKLKLRLMPYIYKTAVEAHTLGLPSMRAMVLEFTEDITCQNADKQYMFGDSLLVAPVFKQNGDVDVYLPEGKWTNYFTGEVKEGGRWYKENHNFLSVPLYVRENSIIASGNIDTTPEYDYEKDVNLSVYELVDGKETSTIIYGQDGSEKISVTALKEGSRITIKVDARDNFTVRLINVLCKSANGAELGIYGNNTSLKASGTTVITCEI